MTFKACNTIGLVQTISQVRHKWTGRQTAFWPTTKTFQCRDHRFHGRRQIPHISKRDHKGDQRQYRVTYSESWTRQQLCEMNHSRKAPTVAYYNRESVKNVIKWQSDEIVVFVPKTGRIRAVCHGSDHTCTLLTNGVARGHQSVNECTCRIVAAATTILRVINLCMAQIF